MAVVNPDLPSDTNTPSGLGYSQGIGTNKTFETIFKGLGDTLGGFANAQDQINQKNIYDDASKQTDDIQSTFGVSAAAKLDGSKTPAGVNQGESDLQVLTKAYQNGTISRVYYDAKLQSMVQGLRQKYPGYNQQIDQIVNNVTGITPANDIVNSIRSDALAGQSKSNAVESWKRENGAYILQAHPDWKGPGDDRWSDDQLAVDVGRVKSKTIDLENSQKELTLQSTQNTLDDKDIVNHARLYADTVTQQYLQGGFSTIGSNYADVEKTLQSYADGTKSITGADAQGITTRLTVASANVKQQVQQGLMNQYIDPNDPSKGTVWSRMSAQDRKDVQDLASAPIDQLNQAIGDQNYGLVRAQALFIETSKNNNAAAMLNSSQLAKSLQALSGLGLPADATNTVVDSWMSSKVPGAPGAGTGRDLLNQAFGLQTTINTINKDQGTLPPGIPDPPHPNDITGNKVPGVDPKVGTDLSKNFVDQLKNNPAQEVQLSAAKVLFDTQGGIDLGQYKPEEASTIYSTFVNPTVTKQMLTLKDTDPTAWYNYTKWAYENFDDIFNRQATDIRNLDQSITSKSNIGWDSKNYQFVVTPNNDQVFDPRYPAKIPFNNVGPQKRLKDAYDNINVALKSLTNVMQADGQDIDKHLPFFMNELGFDPSSLPAATQGSPTKDTSGSQASITQPSGVGKPSDLVVPASYAGKDQPLNVVDLSAESTYSRKNEPLKNVKGIIFHHTAGEGNADGVVDTLNQRRLGVQYVIGKDGTIYQTLPEGDRGAHILNSEINDLNNGNTIGVEVIGANNKDINPKQIEAGKQLGLALMNKYGLKPEDVFGHGQVNPGHKEADEGQAIVQAIQAVKPNANQTASNQPSTGPGGTLGTGGIVPLGQTLSRPGSNQSIVPLSRQSSNGQPAGPQFAGGTAQDQMRALQQSNPIQQFVAGFKQQGDTAGTLTNDPVIRSQFAQWFGKTNPENLTEDDVHAAFQRASAAGRSDFEKFLRFFFSAVGSLDSLSRGKSVGPNDLAPVLAIRG